MGMVPRTAPVKSKALVKAGLAGNASKDMVPLFWAPRWYQAPGWGFHRYLIQHAEQASVE